MKELQEITPLTDDKLYMSSYYFQNQLDFPIHYHEDYELNLTCNARGKRIVGTLVEDLDEYDLTLVFPDVVHCYKRAVDETCLGSEVTVVQFSKDMPLWRVMSTVQFSAVCNMLSMPVSGLKFSKEIARILKNKIQSIAYRTDFESGMRFLEILNFLACVDPADVRILGSEKTKINRSRNGRICKIIKFTEDNFSRKISLSEIGELVGMSASSVSRLFKKRTGHNYWDFLMDCRLESAQRMITGTELSISEIAYSCGFNSPSNFNKVFREKHGITPKLYRERFKKSMQ